ncbi:hypothetical protein M0802_012931 [Mischocyttarus mexicanus]|nr:hypothetical protein M0802_012931 [Mischocyttarus mexicanus]
MVLEIGLSSVDVLERDGSEKKYGMGSGVDCLWRCLTVFGASGSSSSSSSNSSSSSSSSVVVVVVVVVVVDGDDVVERLPFSFSPSFLFLFHEIDRTHKSSARGRDR